MSLTRPISPPPIRRAGVATIIAIAAVAALTGCATPAHGPPTREIPLPGAFSATGNTPLPGTWWRHFDDPALDRVMTRVIDENFSLAAARARLSQARAAARVASGGRLPTLDGTGQGSRMRRETGAGTEYTVGVMASYEVDLWGRLESTADAARYEAEATGLDLRAAAITLTADAATTYFGVLRQRALASLIRRQRQTNRRIEELVELRYRNGQGNIDEVLRQRQLVESTSAELASATGELGRLRARLAALEGGATGTNLGLGDGHSLIEVPALPDTGLPSAWLNRRPDLQAAFLRVRSANAEVASAVAARYPRLDLSASLETAATSPGALFEEWFRQLAADLTVPAFRGGVLSAEVDRSRAARAVAFNTYAQDVLDAVAEVETALQSERTDRTRVESLQRQVALGERVLEQLRFRYQNGAADYLDVLDALSTLQTSQRSLLAARWALVIDRIALARAIAGGWRVEDEGSDTEMPENT